MKNLAALIGALALVFSGASAFATAYEYDTEGGKYTYTYPYYVVDVPNAASNSLASGAFTITEVASAGLSGSAISYETFKTKTSGTLIKTGGGILELNEALSNWAGRNHVMEGTLLARCTGALGKVVAPSGSRAGDTDATYVHSGATLYMFNTVTDAAAEKKKIVFEGTGVGGEGALLVNSVGNGSSWPLGTDPTLSGDATIRLLKNGMTCIITSPVKFSLNGYTATVIGTGEKNGGSNKGSIFRQGTATLTAGHIVVSNATWCLKGSYPIFNGDASNTMSLIGGSSLAFSDNAPDGRDTKWTLRVEDNSTMYSWVGEGSNNNNDNVTTRCWVGPVVLKGNMRIDYADKNYVSKYGFTGYVSGQGGFYVNSAANNKLNLHLACYTNSFKGAVGVNNNGFLTLHANGALPVDCAGLYLTNSTLRLLADTTYDLPATVVSGAGTITNASEGTSCKGVFTTLSKEGTGTLISKADIVVSNTLSIASTGISVDTPVINVDGTLRFEEGAVLQITGNAKSRGNYALIYASGGITGLPISKTSGYSVYLDDDGKTLVLTYGGGTWPAATATATWVGGGVDSLMTTMGNWQDTPASLDLAGGTLAVEVAAGGEMKYSGTTWVASITNQVDFVPTGSGTNTPLWIEPENENDTLVISRGINSVLGKGQIVLKGHIALPHGISGGSASGNPCAINYVPKYYDESNPTDTPEGIIEGYRPAWNSKRWSTPLVLAGAQVDPPLSVRGAYMTIALLGYTGTSNVVNGTFSSTDWQSGVNVMPGATIDFRGGFAPDWKYRFVGTDSSGANEGKVRITNTPINRAKTNNDRSFIMQRNVHLVIDVEGCYIRDGIFIDRGLLEFTRNGCFTDGTTQIVENDHTNENNTQIEFNSTTQRFSVVYFRNTNANSQFRGTYPAMMEVTCVRYGAYSTLYEASTNEIPINGGLGVHVCGDGTFPLAKQNYASCGDLEASAGTLMLCNNATWLNGTNFTARGTGCIKFTKAGQVNSAFAKIRLADSGTIDIPAGVTLSVQSLEVESGGEWVPVESPRYFNASSEEPMAGRITGGGTLRVLGNKSGAILIIL